MSKNTGYSKKALISKLGIRNRMRIKTINAPANYTKLLKPIPPDVKISSRLRQGIDVCHIFTVSVEELGYHLSIALPQINRDGMIWVSWPKKASGITSEVDGNAIRRTALPMGLVDVKVCAIDETWSGLKLVIRKELR